MFTSASNERADYDRIVSAVKQLRRALDITAERAAKENAEWHDDPTAEDHAEYHAPAERQFPQPIRDEAIIDLVRHYLKEEKC